MKTEPADNSVLHRDILLGSSKDPNNAPHKLSEIVKFNFLGINAFILMAILRFSFRVDPTRLVSLSLKSIVSAISRGGYWKEKNWCWIYESKTEEVFKIFGFCPSVAFCTKITKNFARNVYV